MRTGRGPRRRDEGAPRVARVRLDGLGEAGASDLDAGVLLDGVRVSGADLPPVHLAGAELTEVELSTLTADDLDLTGARLREVLLRAVRFSALRAARGDWQDVEVSGRFGVLDAHEARWRSIILDGCKVDFLSLRGVEVDDLLVTGCQIGELDLTGAKVSRLRLDATRVGALEAHDLRSEHLDLRGGDLERVGGLTSLRGALITPEQVAWWAPALAEALGLRVAPVLS